MPWKHNKTAAKEAYAAFFFWAWPLLINKNHHPGFSPFESKKGGMSSSTCSPIPPKPKGKSFQNQLAIQAVYTCITPLVQACGMYSDLSTSAKGICKIKIQIWSCFRFISSFCFNTLYALLCLFSICSNCSFKFPRSISWQNDIGNSYTKKPEGIRSHLKTAVSMWRALGQTPRHHFSRVSATHLSENKVTRRWEKKKSDSHL